MFEDIFEYGDKERIELNAQETLGCMDNDRELLTRGQVQGARGDSETHREGSRSSQ